MTRFKNNRLIFFKKIKKEHLPNPLHPEEG